jgi:hypothetical protein
MSCVLDSWKLEVQIPPLTDLKAGRQADRKEGEI